MNKILKKLLAQIKKIELLKLFYPKKTESNPNYANDQYHLGNIQVKLKEYEKAKNCYTNAIQADSKHKYAQINLGNVLVALNQPQSAINFFEKAIEIDSNFEDAHYNLGKLFSKLTNYQKAISCYEKVIQIDPNYKHAHNNLGVIFQELGDYQKALTSYQKVIQIDPNYKHIYNNIGIVFYEVGDYQKAIIYYKKAIETDPHSIHTLANISSVYISQLNNLEKAIGTSHKVLITQFLFNNIDNISLFRLKHDVQQAKYLKSKNYLINGIDKFQKVGDEILNREENNSDKMISLNSNEVNSLLPFYKATHIYKPKSISGRCINPNKNWLEVEEQYLNSSNQIMYIDDFLSEEALVELREFCLVSKVWHREYKNKYLGAFSNVGFISPIHWQIALDLKKKMPKLFGPHRLTKFDGFKYDTTLGKGINIHADSAIHNLNFWVTPDEYNNNKNSGGLKVYDVSAPDQWTFSDYNTNQDKIYKFLEDNNAKCTNVTYKCNRAVLFNSAYFHETDEIDFKDEYEGQRIDINYLFGNRSAK